MSEPIAFIDLKAQYARLKPEIDAAIARVLAHGRFILGPEVAEFEAALAAYAGVAYAVSCASGTDALTIALMAEGIGPGDAVFLPAFTFTATPEAVALLGARPVFVDVEETSYLIDSAALEAAIDECRAEGAVVPRAVIAVDLFGQPADYEAIGRIAGAHGLAVIADAAQSWGAKRDARRVGSMAPVTALSFFPAKPLGCYGDGGALLTDDEARAEAWRSIRAHGKGEAKYDIVRLGLNSRLDTLQAAILSAKLPAVPNEIAARAAVADRYDRLLGALPGIGLPGRFPRTKSAWAQYTIRLPDRDAVAAALGQQGIPTAVYYPKPLHLQPAYERFGKGPRSLPISERLARQVLSLPMHADLDERTIVRIAREMRNAAV